MEFSFGTHVAFGIGILNQGISLKTKHGIAGFDPTHVDAVLLYFERFDVQDFPLTAVPLAVMLSLFFARSPG
jgi:hypothetical protein